MNTLNYCLGILTEVCAILFAVITTPTAFINRNPAVLSQKTEIITIICHGYLHNRSVDIYLRLAFSQHPELFGPIFSLNLGSPLKSIEDYTQIFHKLVLEIKKELPKDKVLKLNLIGHSMGGLVCTNYAVTYAEEDGVQINKIITIASPLKGTKMANLTKYFCKCTAEMTPSHPFLLQLEKKASTLNPNLFFHISCGMDYLVSPKNTFFRPENNCNFRYQGHMAPIYSPKVAESIIKSLKNKP